MRFKDAVVFDEPLGFAQRDLCVDSDTIADVSTDHDIYDARELYILPGLCDIHLHGAMGWDFMDPEPDALHVIARFEATRGVTAFSPASMTMGRQDILTAMGNAAKFSCHDDEAFLCGIYMEGPFLSQEKCGAQDPGNLLPPSRDFLNEVCKAAGDVPLSFLALAPETAGALDFIAAEKDNVRISLAHTACDYDLACEAFRAGAKQLTHLYNAMGGMLSRAPGPIAAGMDYGADAEIICDGVHVHPAAVRAAFAMYGRERMIMISDSMRATGLDDGGYTLGGQDVTVKGREARLKDGTIAGSVTCLYDGFKNAVMGMRIPLYDAILAAAINPRRALGILASGGILRQGAEASFILCDKYLNLQAVILRGNIVTGEEFLSSRKSA